MEILRQRVPLWSPSASTTAARIARATGGSVRILTPADTPALRRLLRRDPAQNVSVTTSVRARGGAGPAKSRSAAMLLGIDGAHPDRANPDAGGSADVADRVDVADRIEDGTELVAACWVGSNVTPVGATRTQAERFGQALRVMRRRVSSIYGEAEAVLQLYEATGWTGEREIRPEQPLMSISGPPTIAPLPGVRPSRPDEFSEVEPACAAMFTEELGFSPYAQGTTLYHERIRALIHAGHSLIFRDPSSGTIAFKAEFGAVTDDVAQVQGVWVHPDFRGRGLAAPGMAAVVDYGLTLAPTVSLYVNSYNTPAIRAYQRVGFARTGTFATILF